MPWNIPALLDGFTDDCIVRFGDMPEFRGRLKGCSGLAASGRRTTGCARNFAG
jgi:hypothetical protein